jgi:hypothetical protein
MGLVPIKCDAVLNASGLITDKKLIVKCWVKKMIRNNPEAAIQYLRANDVLMNAELDIVILFLLAQM